ncbi:MAG TPA: tol-pal system-associated acyl-CoA thioesterase [Alphaproteobacteria bacterium]|nr:tol-pal system-associated acyl-CoA thioesterase [Alphaproteobacteria bacterium]
MTKPPPVAAEDHRFQVRVYFEDTDAGGIVYYANYLKYAERARTELLRTIGFESSVCMAKEGIGLAVRYCRADFIRPAKLDDQLEVATRVLKVKGASLRLSQVIKRGGEELVDMEIKLACMDGNGKAARLPDGLGAALERTGIH